jgi:hypothetical protein
MNYNKVWPYDRDHDWTDRIAKAHNKYSRKVLFMKAVEIIFWTLLASMFIYSLMHVIVWSKISDEMIQNNPSLLQSANSAVGQE